MVFVVLPVIAAVVSGRRLKRRPLTIRCTQPIDGTLSRDSLESYILTRGARVHDISEVPCAKGLGNVLCVKRVKFKKNGRHNSRCMLWDFPRAQIIVLFPSCMACPFIFPFSNYINFCHSNSKNLQLRRARVEVCDLEKTSLSSSLQITRVNVLWLIMNT